MKHSNRNRFQKKKKKKNRQIRSHIFFTSHALLKSLEQLLHDSTACSSRSRSDSNLEEVCVCFPYTCMAASTTCLTQMNFSCVQKRVTNDTVKYSVEVPMSITLRCTEWKSILLDVKRIYSVELGTSHDCMHDLFEGVVQYEIKLLLHCCKEKFPLWVYSISGWYPCALTNTVSAGLLLHELINVYAYIRAILIVLF